MAPRRRAALLLACLLAAAAARSAGAGTGDGLCDAKESTPTTCVIVADASVPDGTTLTFDLPEVELRSKLTVAFAGRCTVEGATACASDGDCVPPARCDRTGRLTVQAAEKITIDGRGQIVARSQAVVGDEVGPPGGTVILEAHDVTVEGTVVVVADGATGVPAGHGGRIEVHADGSVVIEPGGRLDASTARGGCGGTIVVAQPISMVAGGTVNVDGATVGGTIALTARSYMSIPGTLQASNTNGDLASRPACEDGRPSGSIALAASRLHFSGSAKARGREGAGGVVRFDAERSVILDSAVGTTPISVFGGDTDAFTTGGGVFVSASGGNVELRHGPIEADGLGSGLGSDAGLFSISAAAGRYCDATGAACAGPADCAPGEPCLEAGGDVLVAAPVSAAGGAGGGSGCIACEIRGTGTVTVSGPIDVGGGKRQGVGGKVTIVAGMDLAVGPGMLGADAADGGDVILIAGERAGAARDVSGTLRIAGGTEVHADAFLDNGIGGHIQMEGCEVAAEAESTVRSEGGPVGGSAGIEVVARNRLTIGPLATFSALPDGVLSLTYGADVSVAPDAVLQPPTPPVPDPSLPPCPACGNGVIEPLEDCDGRGTCALPSEVCLPPGADGACTCRDTCGTVPGVQAGEDCDGADLDGQTCASLGFGKGKLACASDCRFDTTQCTEDVCGDGRVGPTEACDPGGIDGAPPAFGETTCESLGHPGGGTLACTADCATVVTRPHCAANVAVACTSDDACGSDGPCVGGCVACGNGFVDPGEACDDGAANGGAGNHCRLDCRAPACGDDTVDFPHCAGDPDALCASAADCGPGVACVAGEECDRGQAVCAGGANDGMPCCRASDCPDGECPGEDCSRNRDDAAGCCRCDCVRAPVACDDCDDGNPCTADGCDPSRGCTHLRMPDGTACGDGDICNGAEACAAGACAAGPPVTCDDGDGCTRDGCDRFTGCRHDRFGVADATLTVDATLFLPACHGDGMPHAIERLLRRARVLLARAGAPSTGARSQKLVARAARKLDRALAKARGRRGGRSAACRAALATVVADARARIACLPGGSG